MTDLLWLQMTSGRGPAECQLAVAGLLDVLLTEARAARLTPEILDAVAGDTRGALLSALVKIEGATAAGFAARWRGSAQWICRSPLRPTHKRRNWFVGVEVLSPARAGPDAVEPRDVVFEALRASGPGGQHVNKTESAVRATHRPTGLVAVAREERSQAMNRKLALAKLDALVMAARETAAAGTERDRWNQHDQLERGNPVRVFVGAEFREKL